MALAYLLTVNHDILNQDERELLFYLGVVVWQAMSQGASLYPGSPRRRSTRRKSETSGWWST
ncbi:MAG: hypothetical protein Q8P22_04230 [Chloroflexota bacterium]|nr:hypothetical protein [Chloroflexota bacterium]